MKSVIRSLQEEIENKSKSCEEVLEQIKQDVLKNQEKCNSFVTILNDAVVNQEKGSLFGIPYALKDNISTKGILTTASSNTLKDYVPVYNATVYERLKKAGATLIGKTVLDEFGLGGSGTTGHTGVVHNPYDVTLQAGGSSAGSAAVVASGAVPFAIGSDTGDSVRKPAAFCGIVGYKPTYGLISRYGLFPFASSLDHVGVLTRTVMDAAIVVDAIKGFDENDMTSFDSSQMKLEESVKSLKHKGGKLFYIKELVNLECYENPSEELVQTLEIFQESLRKAKEYGFEVYEESLDIRLLNALSPSYFCISCAEATSNLSNLTGIIFGPSGEGKNVQEIMIDHRSAGFSPLIKRRLVIGSYVLNKENQEIYFKNAQRVRRIIVEKMNEFFEKYDALILPCRGGVAKSLDAAKDVISSKNLAIEDHMVIGNFGGFPSITIPNGFLRDLPLGINLTSRIRSDEMLLQIASQLEDCFEVLPKVIGGVK